MKVMLINGSPHEKGCTFTALIYYYLDQAKRIGKQHKRDNE